MPYATIADLPESVTKVLPEDAQKVFMEAINGAFEKTPDDEEAANQEAWGAVKAAGYEKNEDGSWIKKQKFSGHTMRDVEVFSAGTHDGDAYTEADLDDMVANFAELGGVIKPCLKLAHRNRAHVVDGQPALGWITALKRRGKKLHATFADMPEIVYRAIQQRLYARVSSEVLWNFRHDGKTFRRVLYAVGLLGADTPVVKDLADLQAFMSQSTDKGSFDALKVCEFAHDSNGSINPQEDDVATIEQLQLQLADEKAKREAAEGRLATFAETEAKRVKDGRIADLKQFCEDQVKAGKMTPAARDIIVADTGVHAYSADTGFAISIERFKTFCEKQGKILDDSERGHDPTAPGGEHASAGEEVDAKARAYSREHKVAYGEAVQTVLAENEDLAKRYMAETNRGDDA